MIVDDHPPAREMIRQFVELPGVTFCECESGEEALQRVRDFKPHWVTMDVSLPGLNGFQATQALRAEHPAARIIIITGHNESHYRQLSRAAGAVALIPKDNLMALRIMLTREMAGANVPTFPPFDEPAK